LPGLTLRTRSGARAITEPGHQPSPWLAIANKQLELMAKYMAELGLSPVSRTRVEAKPPHERKPWEFGREWVDPRPTF
jgi:hypothetical protein